MATVYPTAAGLWSNRTWNDDATGAAYSLGTPQAGDTVKLNGVAVTVDQDITVAEIRNDVGANAVANGSLTINNGSDGFTITANFQHIGATLINSSMASPNSITLNGNLTGGTLNFNHCMSITGNGIITINGDVRGGTSGSTTHGIIITSGATITINGDVYAGTGLINNGMQLNNGNIRLTINGTVYASTSVTSAGLNGTQNIFGTGFRRIEKARYASATASGPAYAVPVTFLDIFEPDIVNLFDQSNVEYFLNFQTPPTLAAKPSLRGGFAN